MAENVFDRLPAGDLARAFHIDPNDIPADLIKQAMLSGEIDIRQATAMLEQQAQRVIQATTSIDIRRWFNSDTGPSPSTQYQEDAQRFLLGMSGQLAGRAGSLAGELVGDLSQGLGIPPALASGFVQSAQTAVSDGIGEMMGDLFKDGSAASAVGALAPALGMVGGPLIGMALGKLFSKPAPVPPTPKHRSIEVKRPEHIKATAVLREIYLSNWRWHERIEMNATAAGLHWTDFRMRPTDARRWNGDSGYYSSHLPAGHSAAFRLYLNGHTYGGYRRAGGLSPLNNDNQTGPPVQIPDQAGTPNYFYWHDTLAEFIGDLALLETANQRLTIFFDRAAGGSYLDPFKPHFGAIGAGEFVVAGSLLAQAELDMNKLFIGDGDWHAGSNQFPDARLCAFLDEGQAGQLYAFAGNNPAATAAQALAFITAECKLASAAHLGLNPMSSGLSGLNGLDGFLTESRNLHNLGGRAGRNFVENTVATQGWMGREFNKLSAQIGELKRISEGIDVNVKAILSMAKWGLAAIAAALAGGIGIWALARKR